MKVMGLSQWVHWIGYLIANYIKLFFNVIILTALMTPLMQQSDFSVILVFFMIYVFDVIYFSFAVSTFMNSGASGEFILRYHINISFNSRLNCIYRYGRYNDGSICLDDQLLLVCNDF
jgi:hypothetical protein